MSSITSVKYLYTQCDDCGKSLKSSAGDMEGRKILEGNRKGSNNTINYKLSDSWICKLSQSKGLILKNYDKGERKAYNKIGEVIVEFKENSDKPSIKIQKHKCPFSTTQVASIAKKVFKKEIYEKLK